MTTTGMTKPTPYTLYARRGDTFPTGGSGVVVTWLEDDEVTPIDLTGYSVEWSIGRGFDDDAATTYTEADAAVSVVAASGRVTLSLTPAQSRALSRRVYQYELTVTSAGGVATTLLEGQLFVSPEVSE